MKFWNALTYCQQGWIFALLGIWGTIVTGVGCGLAWHAWGH